MSAVSKLKPDHTEVGIVAAAMQAMGSVPLKAAAPHLVPITIPHAAAASTRSKATAMPI